MTEGQENCGAGATCHVVWVSCFIHHPNMITHVESCAHVIKLCWWKCGNTGNLLSLVSLVDSNQSHVYHDAIQLLWNFSVFFGCIDHTPMYSMVFPSKLRPLETFGDLWYPFVTLAWHWSLASVASGSGLPRCPVSPSLQHSSDHSRWSFWDTRHDDEIWCLQQSLGLPACRPH